MTQEQTQEYMGMIRDNFRMFYLNVPPERMRQYIKLWAAQLVDIDYQHALNGFAAYMRDNKYPPTLAEIREYALHSQSGTIAILLVQKSQKTLDRFFAAHPELHSGKKTEKIERK